MSSSRQAEEEKGGLDNLEPLQRRHDGAAGRSGYAARHKEQKSLCRVQLKLIKASFKGSQGGKKPSVPGIKGSFGEDMGYRISRLNHQDVKAMPNTFLRFRSEK